MKNGEMGGAAGEMDFVVRGGSGRIVARLQPFQAREREPAIGLQEIRGVRGTPSREVLLPGGVLREQCAGKDKTSKERNSGPGSSKTPGTHTEL